MSELAIAVANGSRLKDETFTTAFVEVWVMLDLPPSRLLRFEILNIGRRDPKTL